MAADKLIDSTKEAACRTAEANAIRAKTGSSATINYDFANNKGFSDAIAAIPTGGGSSKNIQAAPVLTKLINVTTYTKLGSSITVAKTGTYTCAWSAFAVAGGSSTTYATRLYLNNSPVSGSEKNAAMYSASSGISVSVTNVSLTEGDTIEVRGRTSSGASYWITGGALVITEK